METDEDLAETIEAARVAIKGIDAALEDLAWPIEKLVKEAPPIADLAAYVAYRSALEDLRYREVSLRLDKLMAMSSRQSARARNAKRNIQRLRGEIRTVVEDVVESVSQAKAQVPDQ